MTWYLDPDTSDVYWDGLTSPLLGSVSSPYSLPEDLWDVYYTEMFPSDHSSVDVQTLRAGFELCEGDWDFGTPP